MEVQAVTVPLVLLRAAVRVLGVPAPALAVRALEVQVLDTLALEVLHVAVQRAPVQDLLAVVQVLGVLVHVLAAPALETPALGALTPAITLGTPARVDIQGPTLAAPVPRGTRVTPVPRGTRVTPVHKATPATQIHRGTQGLTLVAPAHAAILILTQATQDLRVTLILIQVIPNSQGYSNSRSGSSNYYNRYGNNYYNNYYYDDYDDYYNYHRYDDSEGLGIEFSKRTALIILAVLVGLVVLGTVAKGVSEALP